MIATSPFLPTELRSMSGELLLLLRIKVGKAGAAEIDRELDRRASGVGVRGRLTMARPGSQRVRRCSAA